MRYRSRKRLSDLDRNTSSWTGYYKLYRLLIATFVHDLINNKLPHNFIDYFTYVSHYYETRAKGNYNISLIDIRTNL